MRLPISIPAGIVVDDTTYATGESAWSDADKVRFWRNEPQVIGGWEKLVTSPVTGVCRNVFPWTDNGGFLLIAFGTHTNLEVETAGALYDITPSGLAPGNIDGTGGLGYGTGSYGVGAYGVPGSAYYYPRTWSFSAFGQSLIANPRGGTIYQWSNDVTVLAQPVTNAPANVTAALVTRTRQIMAFGCNEELSGTFNPLCIRYSDIEDITDWTTTATNNAGEYILDAGGRIVSVKTIGNYIYIWTDSALFMATYTGDTSKPWNFDRVGDKCGSIGPNSTVVVDQKAYWFTPSGQFYGCAIGGEPTLVICPLATEVFNNIALVQSDKIVLSSCVQFAEIRMDYPDARDGLENSRYVAFCTVDGAWTRGVMNRTAYIDAGPSPMPVGVDTAGDAYFHEAGQSADGAAFTAFVESADMSLTSDPERVMLVSGIWPDIKSQVGALSLTLAMRMYPQDTERLLGPMVMAPGVSKKDFQVSGRIARLRYDFSGGPVFGRIGKPVYDVKQMGVR